MKVDMIFNFMTTDGAEIWKTALKKSKLGMEPTLPPIQWMPGFKRTGHEAGHSLSRVKVQNKGRYIYLYCLVCFYGVYRNKLQYYKIILNSEPPSAPWKRVNSRHRKS
jgi:hypothetical protein